MKKATFLFISNYINHHQIPFCNAMRRLLGENFVFLQTEPMEEERVRMGWQQEMELPYLVKYDDDPKLGEALISGSDMVLFGGTDEERFIAGRLQENKPVIRYSERLYKEGQWKAVSPRGLRKKYLDHTRYRDRDIYMLCAGAYVPSDFHIVRAYPDKMLRWGYFPETKHYDVDNLLDGKKPGSILWAARFLDWKHPELPLEVARRLKEQGLSFHLEMIGGGEEQAMVEKLIQDYGLQEDVTLRGYLPPDEVRTVMEKSEIYLATSDRNEGWGAVLNEAMNSGCAVVGDHMMGGVPFLIRPGENGMIYRDGDAKMLCRQVEQLLSDAALRRRLGRAAYETITDQWNAETAAKRLVAFCIRMGFLTKEQLADPEEWETMEFAGKTELTSEGPCSPAPVISERKMFETIHS